MIRIRSYWTAAGLFLVGLLLIGAWLYRPVRIDVDGQATRVNTAALTAGAILHDAGLAWSAADVVTPGANTWLPGGAITIHRAQAVQVWDGEKFSTLDSAEKIVGNLLELAGVRIFPSDQVLLDGQPVELTQRLPAGGPTLIQVRRAFPVNLQAAGTARTIYSSAATLGQALWEAGVRLNPADRLSPSAGTPLLGPLAANLVRARDLVIATQGGEIHLRSAAATVGQALAEAGLSLQGLSYSLPAETQPIPADGHIRLISIQEQILLQQKQLPFKSAYQADPNTELDQTSVITPGVPGLQVTRVRVLTQDGKEISRQSEAQWTARQPQDQVLGYGTNAVLHTEVVDGVSIQYYRKVTAYATAYSACDAGACGRATASGAPVTKGVIAVIPSWYYAMKGQQVFIPGYGKATIADIGGGIPGTNWVDLGFSESDYTSWHSNVTVYFLAPIPANILWQLP